MDVVLSNIKKIGGSVHVRSWTGKGCRMTLRLPLTLAVLDVMLVKVGESPYVVQKLSPGYARHSFAPSVGPALWSVRRSAGY